MGVDPFLFDKMHALASQQKTEIEPVAAETRQKSSYDVAIEEIIQEEVESLMAADEGIDHRFLSSSMRRAKLEQEVRATLDFSEFNRCMDSAYKILRNEGKQYLDGTDYEALIDSLEKLNLQIAGLDISDVSKLSDELFRATLTIPEESRQLVLKIGIAKFRAGSIDDSLAIFTFLTTVDSDEPDYWYRLGLVAQKCEKYELALKAFAATSWLAPDFIGARIFAAQSYLQIGFRDDAEAELQEAKRIIETTDVPEEWRKHVEDLKILLVE